MKMKRTLSFLSFAAAAILLAASTNAFAGSFTTIDFSCTDGSGTGVVQGLTPPATTPSALCNGSTLVTNNTSILSTWTQGIYTVTPKTTNWYYNPNQGDPKPDLTSVNGTGTIDIKSGGSWFQFDSVDLKGTYTGYNVIGYLNGVGVLDFSCSSNCGANSNAWVTLSNTIAGKDLTDLQITLDGGSYTYLDNIKLQAVPEPNGLLLIGTGMLALALLVRKTQTA